MKPIECKLEDLSKIKYSIARCELNTDLFAKCSIVRFSGVIQDIHDDSAFMTCIALAAVEGWMTDALLLDLSSLAYEWGDWMTRLFSVKPSTYASLNLIGKEMKPFPIAVVISDLNREGLTSLVKDELRKNPKDLLFDSVDEALAALEARYRD